MFEDMLGMCTAKNAEAVKVARTFMFWMFFLSFCLNWHQPVICLSLLNGANPFHIMHKRNRCLSLLTRVPNIHSKSFWLPCRRNIHKGHVQLLNEWLCSCVSRTVPPATLRQDNTYVVWYKLCMYIYTIQNLLEYESMQNVLWRHVQPSCVKRYAMVQSVEQLVQ